MTKQEYRQILNDRKCKYYDQLSDLANTICGYKDESKKLDKEFLKDEIEFTKNFKIKYKHLAPSMYGLEYDLEALRQKIKVMEKLLERL